MKRLETLRGIERNIGHLIGVVEDRGGDGAAEIDIESAPLSRGVVIGESRQALADAAGERTFLFDGVQRGSGGGRRKQRQRCNAKTKGQARRVSGHGWRS